jgi:hypothetical protein
LKIHLRRAPFGFLLVDDAEDDVRELPVCADVCRFLFPRFGPACDFSRFAAFLEQAPKLR